MTKPNLIRLQYGELGHNTLYGVFEARLRAFAEKYRDPRVPSVLEKQLQERAANWINCPKLCGYWLALDGDGNAFSHLCSWIVNFYDTPKLFIWQVQSDLPGSTPLLELFDQLRRWAGELNSTLPPDHQLRVAEWQSPHGEKLWAKYLHKIGLQILQDHNVIDLLL